MAYHQVESACIRALLRASLNGNVAAGLAPAGILTRGHFRPDTSVV